ncbi:GNAT family N-acetyltransferase [Halosolutus gelatinilyticus]|uniref:GNAT family N-acetyltransferase n=1 Tax=Halosolutus gelatinilyticus TaxID=2931975 RepID=UPI001FF40E0D|nr:GNAT family protein [Halosolutus gelatinilyticus]
MSEPAFLIGNSVSLRTVEEEDVEFIHETVNSSEIWKTMQPSRPYSLNEIRSIFSPDSESSSTVRFLVTTEAEPVGLVGFSEVNETAGVAEPSCWIHPDYSGEGYGTEAAKLLIKYGFDHCRLHKFVAEVIEFNEPARHLLEKIGFVEEGRQREQDFVDGEYHDCISYGLLVSEWQQRR